MKPENAWKSSIFRNEGVMRDWVKNAWTSRQMREAWQICSRFAEVTENDILWMQDITIANNTKKATKLRMKIFRDKQCFNTKFAHMSSVFSPAPRQASLMPVSLNNNCPSTVPYSKSHPSQLNFHWPKRLHSKKFECHFLSLKWLWLQTLQQQAHAWHDSGGFQLHKLFFKETATAFTELL